MPLRVVGTGPDEGRLRKLAGPTVRFEGWLSTDSLREAYRGARALLQPHEEDFGIAPLEAMACGTPVVALRRGGGGEVVVSGTGLLFDDPSAEGLVQALASFDPADYEPAALRRRAVEFDREAWKERMRDLVLEAHEAFLRRAEDPEALARLELDPSTEPENVVY